MEFSIDKVIEVLERTPFVLEKLLQNISPAWAMNNEGKDTFSPYDVLGHLIHGEKTDWIPRLEIILSNSKDRTFHRYDRFAQFTESEGKTLNELVAEFKELRKKNIETLKSKNPGENDLIKTAIHPSLGIVTLQQLLATWAVHDLSHIAQIARVMAKQYKEEVGPWVEYLPILTR